VGSNMLHRWINNQFDLKPEHWLLIVGILLGIVVFVLFLISASVFNAPILIPIGGMCVFLILVTAIAGGGRMTCVREEREKRLERRRAKYKQNIDQIAKDLNVEDILGG
jgi:hypothetical protein